MDILHLIDRLEELFNESKSIPLTHTVMVNEDRMLDLIDQMRIAIPEEVKKAQQLLTQRDRILAQAQEEANRTVALAREKAEELIAKDTLIQQAQVRAEQILAQARADAEATRQDADDYVIHTLMQLESEMQRLLTQAQNGIRLLEEEKLQRRRSAPFEDGRQE
ncbi:MAG: ATP synthase F0 subunit B [Candidatus Villigracilaceae bacterium]